MAWHLPDDFDRLVVADQEVILEWVCRVVVTDATDYAIQDTPETVAQHCGRFLPQDKVAIAAQVLNRAWEAA